uniref:transposase n=1 Tax=Acidocella sp. TaxID=50710 RepID=UPI00262F2710
RSLNRIIQNCGRAVIRAKLADFQDRFGVTSDEVNPAYTSQTCSCCGYVDKKNRPSQSTFRCLWCGSTMHADVNAARNIRQRHALSIGSVFQSKASVRAELVRQFRERRVFSARSGGRGSTADPRSTNPYFGVELRSGTRMSGQSKTPNLVLSTST